MTHLHFLDNIEQPARQRSAVAIGVFDGVHRGHQEILRRTVEKARAINATPLALTFDIHPEDLVAPSRAPGYICSLEQRGELIKSLGGGIDSLVVVRFSREFAGLSPREFTESVLCERLAAEHILVGEDFHYGRARSGDLTTLRDDGQRLGFGVSVVPAVVDHGARISSTRIRDLIAVGDIDAAEQLLGHSVAIRGQVVHGKQLGRTLGFPTANLKPDNPRQIIPADGVYSAYTQLMDGRVIPSAVSIGTNPTTDTDGLRKVEANLLDGFDEQLYGQQITIVFVCRLRASLHFSSLEELIRQMKLDVIEARAMLD